MTPFALLIIDTCSNNIYSTLLSNNNKNIQPIAKSLGTYNCSVQSERTLQAESLSKTDETDYSRLDIVSE